MSLEQEGLLGSLNYLHTQEIFACFFGCLSPAEEVNQFQFLLGKRFTGILGYVSAEAGPAYISGMGRGALIHASCADFLDCDSEFEERPFRTVGLALQGEIMLSSPILGIGMGFNADFNSRHEIFALMLTLVFGKVRD
jgi:hypothetical protein